MRADACQRVCYVWPDQWPMGGLVYLDPMMPAPFDVRIETNQRVIESLAVKVERTGRVPNKNGYYRCKITFPGDGEPDVMTRGWMTLS